MTICDDLDDAASDLSEAAKSGKGKQNAQTIKEVDEEITKGTSPSDYGKRKVDEVLNPLRELEAEGQEKILDPTRTEEIGKEITKYGEDKSPNSAGQRLNAMLTGDPQVQSYLGTLNTKEYAALREQIANWFGAEFGTKGAMGRNFENAYKTQRLKNLEATYRPLLGSQIDEMKSAGFLKGGDLTAIDTWETRMDDIVKIKNSNAFRSLDASTRQLDTPDKVDIALSKIDNTTEATKLVVKGNLSPETERTVRAQIEANKINEVDMAKWKEEANFIQNYDYSKLKKGKTDVEYSIIKREVGTQAADEIIRRDAINEVVEIDRELSKTGKLEKLLGGKGLNKKENALADKISSGKTVTIGDLESIKSMTGKITPEGWDIIRRPLRRINTLPPADQARILSGTKDRNLGKYIGAGAIVSFFAFGLPAMIIWSPGGVTNTAEMQGLFQQFSGDQTPTGLLRHFFGKTPITVGGKTFTPVEQMELFFKGLNEYENQINWWLGIPVYGDYIKLFVPFGPNYTAMSIRQNFADIYGNMEAMGLVEKCNSIIGYCETSEETRNSFYTNDKKALYSTKDAEWITKYSNGTDTILAPDGTTLNQATMEALYHYWKTGDTSGVDYVTLNLLRGGLGDNAGEWKKGTGYKTFVDEVIAWGDAKTSQQALPGGQGTGQGKTEAELEEIAVKNAMKRDGITEEAARRNLKIEILYIQGKEGGTKLAALEKITGMVATGGSSGRSQQSYSYEDGGSNDGNDLPSDGESQYGRSLLDKKKYSELKPEEKKSVNEGFTDTKTGEVQFDKIKEKDETVTMKEVAKSTGSTDFVKTEVSKNMDKMSLDEINDAFDTDGEATADAIIDAACGG